MKKFEKYDRLYVKWIDSYSDNSGWIDEEDISEENHFIESLGFFYKQTKDFLIIVHSRGLEDTDVMGVLNIPLGCIKEIKKLK